MGLNMKAIDLWCEMLESGEFEQGKGWLVQRDWHREEKAKYCCLGIACLAAQRSGVEVQEFDVKKVLPDEVISWLEVNSRNPLVLQPSSEPLTVADLNDILCFDFKRIATIIRAWAKNDEEPLDLANLHWMFEGMTSEGSSSDGPSPLEGSTPTS